MNPSKKNSVKKSRSEYHHGDLRRTLLDAALLLVAEHGVQGFTLREAARKAKVSHNAPYRHFASRECLLVELALVGQKELLKALQGSLGRCRNPRDRIIRLGVAYLKFAMGNEASFRVMFSAEVARNPTTDLTLAQNATFDFMETEFLACEKAGLIQPGTVRQHALASWSALHGAAILVLDGVLEGTAVGVRLKPMGLGRLVLDSLLNGIMRKT